MKTSVAAAILLGALTVLPAAAQQSKPDFSRDSLMRFVAGIPQAPDRDRRVRFHVGAVEFGAIGTRWRFNYLPIMMPLSGSGFRVTNELPDPFSLTGTPIATPRRAWRTQRRVDAELKRIEETERAKIKVKVKANGD